MKLYRHYKNKPYTYVGVAYDKNDSSDSQNTNPSSSAAKSIYLQGVSYELSLPVFFQTSDNSWAYVSSSEAYVAHSFYYSSLNIYDSLKTKTPVLAF